jgi:hypothetical protein
MFNFNKEDIIRYFSRPIRNMKMHLHLLVVYFLQILFFSIYFSTLFEVLPLISR